MVSIAKILISLAFFCGFGVCQLSEVAVKDPREEVIEAWYMFDNQRLPLHRHPKEFVSLDKLAELGVLSWRLDADKHETDEELKKIRESRKYLYMDMIEVSPKTLANYEEMKKKFFEEHLHIDEEVRYCLAGSGYFDVRDRNGAWIRIWVKKGGLIVVPAGIYHRFTLDSSNYIKAIRLFAGDPIWTAYYRPDADQLPARRQYVETLFGVIKEGVAATHDVDRVEELETLLGCNKCYHGLPNRICLAQLAEC